MLPLEDFKKLAKKTSTKVVLLVVDGLGGLPHPDTGKTELETAQTPNLDRLAREGLCGLIDPVSPGITPGSAPGHLALFGYDPLRFRIGRGVLEALGIGFELRYGDLAARGNFCTVDEQGLVADRRAGRIPQEKCVELCQKLSQISLPGVELFVLPVREHRFALVLRGDNLSPDLPDTDPQVTGLPPRTLTPLSPQAESTVRLVNEFLARAREILADSHPANMVLLRGFSTLPHLPPMSEVFKLNPAAIAAYPMYRGLAKLVGMKVLESGQKIEEEFETLKMHYPEHDYFYLHVKGTDSAGEDGDFERKVRIIEEVDALLPRVLSLNLDVLLVTGDHSTPAALRAHSWHPVPILLHSRWCLPDEVSEFGERACARGGLGRFPAVEVMPLALAHALKLDKFGA
ncbi:MAG: phosphoglycerate mutase [Chloroflexi bacterium]|nr:MAG: phosphoglycerate mutase [Chloroflexota bacterium]